MDLEAAGKRLDRREKALLQPDDEEPCSRLRPARRARETLLPRGAVLVEEAGERKLRRVVGKAVDNDAYHVPLGKPALHGPDVLLEPAHHHVFEGLLAAHLNTPGETVGVEKLEERGKAVRVAVVRGRGKEQAVLEAASQIAHRPGQLGFDAVAPAAGRRGVMRFVED